MNKKLMVIGLVAGSLMVSVAGANADVYVRGHIRSNGSYVAPHYRSAPDWTASNNWSSQDNVNPYTGSAGSRNPYGSSDMLYRSSNSGDLLGRAWGSTRLY